jgi:hypothetical protein
MKTSAAEHETPSRLLGQLAHETSVLVRSEVELAAAERLPALHRIGTETAAALAAAVASVFACTCVSWAAVRGAELFLTGWAAPLVVAGGWLLIAASLLAIRHPRRHPHLAFCADPTEIARSARRTRATAEQAVRETAERLVEAAARRAAARELKIAAEAVEHAVGSAEADARYLLKELAAAMSAGGRAGVGVLERVVGRKGG